MRLARFALLLLAVLVLTACMQTTAPQLAPPEPAASSELDALMYGPPPPAVLPVAARRVVQVVPVNAVAPADNGPYTLDAGDKLRIVVFGQDTLSNTYTVDASGCVTMPLIGAVVARGLTTSQLSGAIAARLKSNFIRDPSVAVEVEVYRPFFVLGEVAYPGQYPYVPHMTIEKAVAIAGGFTPRAFRTDVTVTRKMPFEQRITLPLAAPVRPGDAITVAERWF